MRISRKSATILAQILVVLSAQHNKLLAELLDDLNLDQRMFDEALIELHGR